MITIVTQKKLCKYDEYMSNCSNYTTTFHLIEIINIYQLYY